jgi:DNA-binding SARP family transcriptional activator/Tfp pilus assembly protein PilF
MNVEFRILGALEIYVDGRQMELGGGVDRRILGALLLHPNQPVSLDRLAEAAWGDQWPATARRQIQNRIGGLRRRLRQASGCDLISAHPVGYQIEAEPEQLDALRFDQLIGWAAEQEQQDDPTGAATMLRHALALWRGPVLADLEGGYLGRLALPRQEQRLAAVERCIDLDLGLGRHEEVVAELRQLTAEYPLRERLVGQLMLALYRGGRQADALSAYHDLMRRLSDDLGLDPNPDLRRLHDAILREDPTLQIPRRTARGDGPASTAQPRPAQLPADIPAFAGRTAELAGLDRLLADRRTGNVAAISTVDGTAGIGKTTLAVHWAHRVAGRFPDGQLYVNLRGFDPSAPPMPPADAIRVFLDALAVPPERVPATLDAQIALYRSLLAGKNVLVVLDNARDADQVRPLLPGAPGCAAVITSRNQFTSLVAVEGAQPLTLDLLTADESHLFLTSRLGCERVTAEPQAVAKITTHCAGLPLALAIVAARAAISPARSLADLVADLHGRLHRLDTLDGGDAVTNVRAVFSWSYQALTPAAARLFRLLGLHAGPDIGAPAAASLAGLPIDRVRRLLAELTGGHLLVEHRPGRYTCHDLLRAYAAEQVHANDTQGDRHTALCRALDHYMHTARAASLLMEPNRDPVPIMPALPGVEPEPLTDDGAALAWFNEEYSVLLAAVDKAVTAGLDLRVWQIAWYLGTFLARQGHLDELAAAQGTALAAAERLGDRKRQAKSHRGLAHAYVRLGRFDDAATHLRQALRVCDELGDHVGRAHTCLHLAWLCGQRGEHREGLAHNMRALDDFRSAGHQVGQARALNAVGWTYATLGDHRQALAHCEEALALLIALDDRHGAAGTWDSLGYAHLHLGHHKQAATCYRHAVDLYRRLGDRLGESTTLQYLGDVHEADGDQPAARAAWQQALTILDDLDDPDADQVRAKLHHLDTNASD